MAGLPDAEGLSVAVDTETSGLFVDDGSRVAVVSYAYRQPTKHAQKGWIQKPDAPIVAKALAFDQGITDLPLGDKDIPSRHWKRINKTKPIEAYIGGQWRDDVIPQEWFLRPAPNLDPKWFDYLVEWLRGQRITWHNMKFDLQQIRAGLRGREGGAADLIRRDLEEATWWDTQLVQAVFEPQYGTSLKPTAERLHLGAQVGIAEGHEADEQRALGPWRGPMTGKNADPRYDLIPWEVMDPYATGDPLLTLLLQEWQGKRLDEDMGHWWSHIERQFDLAIALYRMENRGIGFDVDGCLVQRDRLMIAKGRAAERLPFDPTPDKARVHFFNPATDPDQPGLGAIPRNDKMTPGGKPQVDEEVIEALTKHPDPRVAGVAVEYQRHEEIKSALSKWYDAWPHMVGPDGRLRTNYRQARVVSGRLSAERAQLQAIPHDYQLPDLRVLGAKDPLISIREFFVPRKGFNLWELDVANAEPRIATMIARCEPMYQAVVVDGQDTHSAATLLMFQEAMGEDFGPEHEDWTEYRQVGKRCNLGILYAAGPGAIRDQIRKFTGIEYEYKQVEQWVRMYKRAFPQFQGATDWWSRFCEKTGYVRLINGRLRYFAPHEPLHKAFNQVIQGSVAETMTDAMIDVERLSHDVGGLDAMLLQVHDSLVLEVPEGPDGVAAFALAAATVRHTFEKAFTLRWAEDEPKRFMPFPVDAKPFGRSKVTVTKEEEEAMTEAIAQAYAEISGRANAPQAA